MAFAFNHMQKFSVLLPLYIKEKPEYLDEAIKSTIQQTLVPSEILIAIDGPVTPGLEAVINKYLGQYPDLIRVYRQPENIGLGITLNNGLQLCNYDLVARMDSDDICQPHRFEEQVKFMEEHPEIDVVGSMIEEFEHTPGDLVRFRKLPLDHEGIVSLAKLRCPVNHMTVMYRKGAVLAAGGYWNKRVMEDYYLWYKLLQNGSRFQNLDKSLVFARVGNNMVNRRRGYAFFKNEMLFYKQMRDDKFISSTEYYKNAGIRFVLRMMPTAVLKVVYRAFLRS